MPTRSLFCWVVVVVTALAGCKEVAFHPPPGGLCTSLITRDSLLDFEEQSSQSSDGQGEYLVGFDDVELEQAENILFPHGIEDVQPVLTKSRLSRRIYAIRATEEQRLRLEQQPGIAYIEPIGYLHTMNDFEAEVACTEIGPQSTPAGIVKIEAPDVHHLTQGEGVVAIVIDSGIAIGHPDFPQERILGGKCVRKDCEDEDNINDTFGHGSHVAGIIGAEDNDLGVVGVAPKVSFYIIKIFGDFGSATSRDVLAGINEAVRYKLAYPDVPMVANMSFGGGDSEALEDAIVALADAGVIIVASAGNHGDGNPDTEEVMFSPAAFSSPIAVAATDGTKAAVFSVGSNKVEFTGPGVGVVSDMPRNTTAPLNGTSMSAPHVTGSIALLLALDKERDLDCGSRSCIVSVLKKSLRDYGTEGFDVAFGFGEPRLFGAVEHMLHLSIPCHYHENP